VSVALRWRPENLDLELETRRLILLLRETERSLLAFALYRTVAEREAVARELRERLPLPVEEFTLTTVRRNPFDLIEGVKADGRVACFVYDVEEAFPEALGYLNLQRERLAELPHAVVFWVREHDLRQIGVQAPDFWAWRSGVFDFRAPEERAPLAAIEMAVAEPFTYLDRGDLERRLSLYQGLLEDYSQEERPDEAFLAGLERKIGSACYYLGEWTEARAHLQRALEISKGASDEEGRAVALHSLGVLAQDQGDYASARRYYQQSLEIKGALGNRVGVAYTLGQLGNLAYTQGYYVEARRNYEEALRVSEEFSDKKSVATVLHQLGMLTQAQGDYPAARRYYQQSLETFQTLGDRTGVSKSLHQLGVLAQDQGDYPAARHYYEQSLEIKEALGDRTGRALTTWGLGNIAYDQGDYDEAKGKWQEALAVFEELGDKRNRAGMLHQLGTLAQTQGDYAAARSFYQQSLNIAQALGDRARMAISTGQLGRIAELEGDYVTTVRMWAQALQAFEALGSPNKEIVAGWFARLREELGEEAFERVLEEAEGDNDELS